MSGDIYKNQEYLNKNPNWHVEDSPWKAGNILKILERNGIKPDSVAEIGVGAGEILKQLQQNLPASTRFDGFDISPQAIELCKQRENANLHCYLKDLLEEGALNYDVVMAIDVFEHVEDYLGFLKKLKNKGNYKIFHIPLDLSVQTVLRNSPIQIQRQLVGHIHYYTKDTALESLKHAGYEVLDYFYTATAIDLPPKSIKAVLAKIPRKVLFGINQDIAVRLLGGYSLMVLTK